MSDHDGRLRLAIANLINANERMQVNLESNALVLKQAMVLLTDGIDLSEALFLVPTSSQREAAEQALRMLQGARNELRTAIVTAGLESGVPLHLLAERLDLTPEQVKVIATGSQAKEE